MDHEDGITVEVVYATPAEQIVLELHVPPGATVAEAIERSHLAARLPDVDLLNAPVGIFGRVVSRDEPLRDGDRVEIYRPLVADPKQARRRRAAGQR